MIAAIGLAPSAAADPRERTFSPIPGHVEQPALDLPIRDGELRRSALATVSSAARRAHTYETEDGYTVTVKVSDSYVADPDDHAWEIAWNPAWPIDSEGHVSFGV